MTTNKDIIAAHYKAIATKGGNARWKNRTAEEKSAHGKLMAAKRKAKKLSTSETLHN